MYYILFYPLFHSPKQNALSTTHAYTSVPCDVITGKHQVALT